ncbi:MULTISPECIES: STAS domain-containing protein [Pseudoalteromonas]|uniref:STAS domain-containing protein n=1 Tax=Pseudoalteromonas maricaloris TaxID=184924 RepID=A0A8I2KPT1_9GAMM|nr:MULTISPECIES: STAS domain-containing protein [Pseudoalteromonas]AUJ71539.1 hypothetical protein PNC201_16585 [Pseudoalteromonas sp. NC201]KID39845.1 hypothetical protein QT15_00110 [Pseudoalteromonas flavipulchra NCIMB 2033 = ATCC BAA-314]KJZ04107.1 hypothetical protein TW73_04905 [Pseudoalteromonas piscicida]MBD0784491.1 STAS domain-containing protein [Pseudoalteromonas flavipulchra]MBR8842558.1 STAS domain-containing protein [Pseudoalteromonas sp. JC3]
MLKLPPEMAINHVESLYHQIFQDSMETSDITIDISEVQRADTASIQLLCAVQKHLLSLEHKIVWHGESDALAQAVNELGLTHYLFHSIEN